MEVGYYLFAGDKKCKTFKIRSFVVSGKPRKWIGRDFLAIGTTCEILIMWKEDRVRCVEYIMGECSISCLFKNRKGSECWVERLELIDLPLRGGK